MPRNPSSFDAITSNGYRPGFEPRPGETEAQRLRREEAYLIAKSNREAAERRKKQQEDRTSRYGGPSLFNYQAPMPPKAGYRRGFEPRPGESESERLKREAAWLIAKNNREAAERRKKEQEDKTSRYGGPSLYIPRNAAGGPVSKPKPKGGSTASKRADGIARKGKTKGKMV